MKTSWAKGQGCLVPMDDEAREQLNRLAPEVVIDIKNSRNPQFHRYAMAMFTRLHEMSDEEAGFDPWRKWLTIKAGWSITTGFADGSVQVEAMSLAFEKMSQDKFEKCWRDIHQAFCATYGQKMTYDELTEWSQQ